MRYAITYVSTAAPNLSREDAGELLERATNNNNSNGITGVLLSSETNFFQLIEGEEEKVKKLYSEIEKDPRHHNLIKIIEKPVIRPAYDGYICGVVTSETKFNCEKLKDYIHHIEVLDPVSRKSVKAVIEALIT